MPVGTYTLTVSAPGFQTRKIDAIDVAVTRVEDFPVVLSVGSESTEIEVTASGVQADTESSALITVVDSKAVEDSPLNGRDFTRLTHIAPGVSALTNSVNGSRTASINFQLDGADNVDPWLGIVASNQGGIASVPGGLIPIEAIDQFSMQSGGEADQGRNAGANSNMVIKSGTNNLHGDVFYFDRNEFFAAINPFAAVGSKKILLRNHQGGFTLGGPRTIPSSSSRVRSRSPRPMPPSPTLWFRTPGCKPPRPTSPSTLTPPRAGPMSPTRSA